jgi:hypothetical protein
MTGSPACSFDDISVARHVVAIYVGYSKINLRLAGKKMQNGEQNFIIWISYIHNNNNNNNIYLLKMGCHPVAVITLHVFPDTANKFT